MWGRELRAGLVFVLLSVAAGSGFRGWQRAHQERFDEIVASLVEADATSPATTAAAARPGAPSATLPDSAGGVPAGSRASSAGRRAEAEVPRSASIDVDRASAEELERLPGIGPALAARIIAERGAGGRFGGPDGLLRVHGIGPKTLARIRPYLTRPSGEAGSEPAPAAPDRAK
jgi:competence protein ComEA